MASFLVPMKLVLIDRKGCFYYVYLASTLPIARCIFFACFFPCKTLFLALLSLLRRRKLLLGGKKTDHEFLKQSATVKNKRLFC